MLDRLACIQAEASEAPDLPIAKTTKRMIRNDDAAEGCPWERHAAKFKVTRSEETVVSFLWTQHFTLRMLAFEISKSWPTAWTCKLLTTQMSRKICYERTYVCAHSARMWPTLWMCRLLTIPLCQWRMQTTWWVPWKNTVQQRRMRWEDEHYPICACMLWFWWPEERLRLPNWCKESLGPSHDTFAWV